ncbi:hypothetical protein DLM75_03960 [Leptospira stimsonii]|uniref:Uncharacterized protein n=1 Tax=Leptospira stimsonii TaxID=2202203 RepID=A0A396ZGS9_9LEPT|nr:hypothetical protein DLM75_03960 [Leptospira stimsonii]
MHPTKNNARIVPNIQIFFVQTTPFLNGYFSDPLSVLIYADKNRNLCEKRFIGFFVTLVALIQQLRRIYLLQRKIKIKKRNAS